MRHNMDINHAINIKYAPVSLVTRALRGGVEGGARAWGLLLTPCAREEPLTLLSPRPFAAVTVHTLRYER